MASLLDTIPLQLSFADSKATEQAHVDAENQQAHSEQTFPQTYVLWTGRKPMSNRLLSIILEERKHLENVDGRDLVSNLQQFGKSTLGQRHIFKDYLLSSEVFYIDTDLNVAKGK